MRPYGAFAIGAILVTAGCQTPAHHEAKQQAEQRWREVRARVKLQLGRQQLEGGLFEEAIASLSEATALDAGNAEPYVLLARANLELSRLASAQAALDAGAAHGPKSADWHYMQGVIHEQRDNLDLAIAEYEQARTLAPGEVDYVIAYAESLVAARREGEALALLDENLHRFDDGASVAALAGHVAMLLGDHEQAVQYFALAAIDAPDPALVAEPYGLSLARTGRCDQAAAVFERYRDGDQKSHCSAAQRTIAACELVRGDASAAMGRLREFVAVCPDDLTTQVLLAQAAIEIGDPAVAQAAIQTAERQSPDDPALPLLRAAFHYRQAEFAAAAGLLYDLLERRPADPDALRLLGEVLLHQDQPEAAQDCFDRADRLSAAP